MYWKFHLAIKKDIERKKGGNIYSGIEISIGANARRSRALNLSEVVKGRRGSFTNFQFDDFEHRSKPLYSYRSENLHRLSHYFPLERQIKIKTRTTILYGHSKSSMRWVVRDPTKRPRDSFVRPGLLVNSRAVSWISTLLYATCLQGWI